MDEPAPISQPSNGETLPTPIVQPLELPPEQLEKAIVSTLEGRPKHSSMRAALAKCVLKYLSVSVRGKARKEFKKRVNQAAAHLRVAGILQFYVATNKRVKLTPDYAAKFARRRQRMARKGDRLLDLFELQADTLGSESDPSPLFGTRPDDAISNSAVDRKPRSITLPELPDDVNYNVLDREEGAPQPVQEGPMDEDSRRGLSILAGSPPETGTDLPAAEKGQGMVLANRPTTDIVTALERALACSPDLEVKRVFHELRLRLACTGGDLLATVSHNPVLGVLNIKTILPFVESAAIALLQLFGREEFTGALCVELDLQGPQFVVRKTIDTKVHHVDAIRDIIDQVLCEALRTKEILGRFK